MSKAKAIAPYRILFVCMGNICRSPLAEGVTRTLAQRNGWAGRLDLDSAGTHGHYHAGEPADLRARRLAAKRGYDISRHRARPVVQADFQRFDLLLAMDESNMSALLEMCPGEYASKLQFFLSRAPNLGLSDIPDPYYGADSGFERVLDLCELAAKGLLKDLSNREEGP